MRESAVTRVKFVQHDGTEDLVEVGPGVSVMLAAVRNGIAGIEGECGGCLDCGTCHVYVDPDQVDALAPPQPDELELLAATARRRDTSRLGCQIKPPPTLDALIVYVPEARS